MVYALLIDDDDQIVEVARNIVADAGLELETASSWDEGLDKVYALAPDLVISDYNLPGSEMGISLLIKVAETRPSVRLVLISAYLNEGDVEHVRELNVVDDVFRKISPMDTARRIVEEVRAAARRSEDPTDWVSFSQSSLRQSSVDEDAVAKLDMYLRSNRLPKDGRGANV